MCNKQCDSKGRYFDAERELFTIITFLTMDPRGRALHGLRRVVRGLGIQFTHRLLPSQVEGSHEGVMSDTS